MIGGYESARRWNAHYSKQEAAAGVRARAELDRRADELRAAFPRGATWDQWYDWAQANIKPDHDAMYHYGIGRSGEAHLTYQHFLAIVGAPR